MMTWIRSVSGRIGCVRIGRQEVGPMPLDIPHPIWRDPAHSREFVAGDSLSG
jgi:hypothetical protein